MIYPDGQKYLCIAQRDLECGKEDYQISINIEKSHISWINQKIQQRKVLDKKYTQKKKLFVRKL